MTQQPEPDNSPPAVETEHAHGSVFILGIIVFTICVAIGMVALVYAGWLKNSEPSSMIVIEADKKWDGVLIEVAALRANAKFGTPIPVVLSERNGYVARYYLEPGVYEVSAWSGEYNVFRSNPFQLPDGRAVRQPVGGRPPTTVPTSERRAPTTSPSTP